MKKNKIVIITSIVALILIIIGITYAYFTANIEGVESVSTITTNAGTLEIEYSDNSNIITAENMVPSDKAWITKEFTLKGKNTTELKMYYKINIVVEENTFTSGAITYSLSGENTGNSGQVANDVENASLNSTITIGEGYFSKGENKEHNYKLEIYFKNKDEDQSVDMNKKIKAHIEIEAEEALEKDEKDILVYFDANGGEVSIPYKEVTVGNVYGNLPTPEREGYEFLGWNGKNLFNEEEILMAIDDAEYIDNHYVFESQRAYNKYSTGIPQLTEFKSNNQYTITIVGYTNNVNGYFRIYLVHEDSSLSYRYINYTSDTSISYSSNVNTTIKKVTMTFGNGCKIYISSIQLEEGTKATVYEPYYVTSDVTVTQDQDHTLKAIWKAV